MIQTLLTQIIERLQTELGEHLTQPKTHIIAIPITEPKTETLPLISIYPGKLEINQTIRETTANQPCLQEQRQDITVSPNPPTSYKLTKTPLKDSTRCQIVINEQEKPLKESTDFTINYQQATITFKHNLSNVSKIQLQYSFLGILTVREFQQDFLIDICDQELTNIEKISSLAAGIIITNHDELIQYYNFTQPTEYQTDKLTTIHTINQIHLLEGIYTTLTTPLKLQLRFNVIGQLKLTKTITEGVSPIKEIKIRDRLNRMES